MAGLRRRRIAFDAHCLTDGEFAVLGRALDGAEADHPVAVATLRFLLYTGTHKSNALHLRWEQVHSDRAVLPDFKVGLRAIWLAPASPRNTCGMIAPKCLGPRAPTPSLDKAWDVTRDAAGLGKLRIDDLRYAHAVVPVNDEVGLRVVAGLLGHADIATTFGYAHLAEGSAFTGIWS